MTTAKTGEFHVCRCMSCGRSYREDEVTRLKVKLATAETALQFYADPSNYTDSSLAQTFPVKTKLVGDTSIEGETAVPGSRAREYFKQFPG